MFELIEKECGIEGLKGFKFKIPQSSFIYYKFYNILSSKFSGTSSTQ